MTLKNSNLIRVFILVFLNLVLLPAVHGAGTTSIGYPQKTITIIVPFPPGGSADIVARIVGKRLSEMVAQPVIIENKPGADGAIAAEYVAKAEPDGHTLFMATYGAMSAVPALHKHLAYDVLTDFSPITSTGKFPFFLFIHPSLPVKTLGGFIEYVHRHPGEINYGTGNAGSIMAMAELSSVANLKLFHVPYKGEVPAMADLITGRIQVMFATPTNAISWVQEGKLRALVTLLEKHSPLLPEVPTMAESGMKSLSIAPWAGLFGPSKMPKPIVDKLSNAVNTILMRQDVRAEFAKQGFDATGSTPEQLGTYVKEQVKVWHDAVKTAGIVPE
jgi:tripartite-type tricarboxylate transporter receptor subunit TctC